MIIFVTNLSLPQLIDNGDCLGAKMLRAYSNLTLFDTKPADTGGRSLEKAVSIKILSGEHPENPNLLASGIEELFGSHNARGKNSLENSLCGEVLCVF